MSTFFFSGIEKSATAAVLIKESAAGMMSQLLYRENLLTDCGSIPLVMDSGAFTKELTMRDIEKYASIIQKLGDRCIWYANADCIGNQEKSNENYKFLCSLLSPDMQERVLWVYQVSAPISYLYQGLQEHKRIGIGGLVPIFRSPNKSAAYYLLRQLATIIAEYDADPHYFGLSAYEACLKLRDYHRRFSVDSTTWLDGVKYGLLIDKKGKQVSASEMGYDFTNEALLSQNVRTMRKWVEQTTVKKKVNPKQPEQLSFFSQEKEAS